MLSWIKLNVREVVIDLSAKKNDMKMVSQVFMGGASVSVLLAAVGYLGTDIWLASTQWLLVAAVLALFGVYMRMDGK